MVFTLEGGRRVRVERDFGSEDVDVYDDVTGNVLFEQVKVFADEYESVDTEKDLENAIEAEPKLLFRQPVELLARQHHIYTDEMDRHIVDLVFLDRKANEVILVELKRGQLLPEHGRQISRYLTNADQSSLLRGYLDEGWTIRGLLATVAESDYEPDDPIASTVIVDRKRVIKVLKQLRDARLAGG